MTPDELERIRERARLALQGISGVAPGTNITTWHGVKSTASRQLPEPYLLYFLLIDLLGFPHTGPEEKLAWAVPLECQGVRFSLEHRKLGLALCSDTDHQLATFVAQRLQKAAHAARPYFDALAKSRVAASEVNLLNLSSQLYAPFVYMRDLALQRLAEADLRDGDVECHRASPSSFTLRTPSLRLLKEARWHAQAAIEFFFGWTEHVLIHLAVLTGRATTAAQIAEMVEKSWPEKFLQVVDLNESGCSKDHQAAKTLRSQLRNFASHGAFGKDGEAFHFHSSAGAVPVRLPTTQHPDRFRLGSGLEFDAKAALATVRQIESRLWWGPRAAAEVWITNDLDTVLTFAADGTYERAMRSVDEMQALVRHWSELVDRAGNMDW
jgi:hypothetical protein